MPAAKLPKGNTCRHTTRVRTIPSGRDKASELAPSVPIPGVLSASTFADDHMRHHSYASRLASDAHRDHTMGIVDSLGIEPRAFAL
jgi:hypothetical protein